MIKNTMMLIMLLLAVFGTKPAKARAYRPMLVDSVRWIVVYDLIDTPWNDDARWEYFALGDTLVNGMEYKKIYHRYLEANYEILPPYEAISPYVLSALMREDTIARQVFGIPLQLNYLQTFCPTGQESLLYDFSLSVNDTLNNCIASGLIEETGDVFFQEINTRYFQTDYNFSRYYEGIGSDYGLFEAMFTPVKSSNLWHLRLEYYCPNSVCPFIVSTNEITAEKGLVIYPNPANNWVSFGYTLESEKPQAVLEIRDAAGKTVHQVQLSQPKGEYVWDTRQLQAGTYYYSLKTGSSFKTGKVVIVK